MSQHQSGPRCCRCGAPHAVGTLCAACEETLALRSQGRQSAELNSAENHYTIAYIQALERELRLILTDHGCDPESTAALSDQVDQALARLTRELGETQRLLAIAEARLLDARKHSAGDLGPVSTTAK